jgi:peptidoglycan/LPS O-acetylase OafA/YrhL
MFNLRDIEAIEKYGAIIYMPLIAAACIAQPPVAWVAKDIQESWPLAVRIILLVVVWSFVAGLPMVFLQEILLYLDRKWTSGFLLVLFAVLFICFGVLVVCKLGGPDPFPMLGPLWNLAALAYGFQLHKEGVRINYSSRP